MLRGSFLALLFCLFFIVISFATLAYLGRIAAAFLHSSHCVDYYCYRRHQSTSAPSFLYFSPSIFLKLNGDLHAISAQKCSLLKAKRKATSGGNKGKSGAEKKKRANEEKGEEEEESSESNKTAKVDPEEFFKETKRKMEKILESGDAKFANIEAGRANPSMLDKIRINYKGSLMAVRSLSNIYAIQKENALKVECFEEGVAPHIEKAILASNMGYTTRIIGTRELKVIIPPVTQELRLRLVSMAKSTMEEIKILLRNARRDAIDKYRQLEKKGFISEDDLIDYRNKVQEMMDDFIGKLEKQFKNKEKDLVAL